MEEGEPRFLGVTAEGGRKKKKKKKRSGIRQAFPPLFTAFHADNSFNYSKEFEPLRAGNVDSERFVIHPSLFEPCRTFVEKAVEKKQRI